jgi:hypothetical protein
MPHGFGLTRSVRKAEVYDLDDRQMKKKTINMFTLSDGPHGVGPMCWGRGATENTLFLSTEPNDPEDIQGVHGYVHAERLSVKTRPKFLDNLHAGDALCVDPSGTAHSELSMRTLTRHILQVTLGFVLEM